jgi:hypothetical protein
MIITSPSSLDPPLLSLLLLPPSALYFSCRCVAWDGQGCVLRLDILASSVSMCVVAVVAVLVVSLMVCMRVIVFFAVLYTARESSGRAKRREDVCKQLRVTVRKTRVEPEFPRTVPIERRARCCRASSTLRPSLACPLPWPRMTDCSLAPDDTGRT